MKPLKKITRRTRKNKSDQNSLSIYAQAFQMFKDKLSLEDVAIELDIDTDTVLSYYKDVISIYVSMANAIDSRILNISFG